MRHVLLDYAKAQGREKRGGDWERIALSEALLIPDEKAVELVALDEALEALAKQDARKGRIVELRYFGGCAVEETAQCLGASEATVAREWCLARA